MADRSSTLVIVNPMAAGGSTGRRWPQIRDLLSRHLDFDVAFSQYAGHAIELGREARDRGYPRIVCVGGDGTLNELVNGAMDSGAAGPMPKIGIIPAGTGADFARSVGIPHRIDQACARLANPRAAISDLGVVSYGGEEGPKRRYFVNAAGLGFDAEVVSRRNGFNRYLKGTIPYLVSLATTLLSYQNKDVTVCIDGIQDTRRVNALVIALGCYFGGGMRIAPQAVLDDDRFDVVTIGDVGRMELVYNVPGVYRGTHLRHPRVKVEKATLVRVQSEQRVLIQADGELLGLVPAQFEIIPGALTILC